MSFKFPTLFTPLLIISMLCALPTFGQNWTFYSGTHLFAAQYEHENQPEQFRFFGLHLGVGREAVLDNGWRRQWNLQLELSHSNFPSILFQDVPPGQTQSMPVRVESVAREGVLEGQFVMLGPNKIIGGLWGVGLGFGRSQKINTTMYYGPEEYWTETSWDTNIIALRVRLLAGAYWQMTDLARLQLNAFGFSYTEPAIISGSSYNVVGWGGNLGCIITLPAKE